MKEPIIIRKPFESVCFSEPTALQVTLTRATDMVCFNQHFLSQFVFRGQSDAKWPLSTSLERFVKNRHFDEPLAQKALIYESEMLNDFRKKYPLYRDADKIDLDNSLECLCLMQHYGCPTRLLDFSDSIFVALFMALTDNYGEDSAIWAVRKFETKEYHFKNFCSANNTFSTPTANLIQTINAKSNDLIGKNYSNLESIILPIFPSKLNERSSIQQGCFLMPSTVTIPFQDVFDSFFHISRPYMTFDISELLRRNENPVFKQDARNLVLIKIIIPSRLKWELSQLLQQMNITSETLYPGFEGMIKSLAYLRLREPNYYID